jgi:hypothetical protein
VAAAVLVIALAPAAFYLTQIAVLGVSTAHLKSAQAELTESSRGVRSDRSAALADREAIDAYFALEPYPPQFELVNKAMHLIADKNVSISDWTYDNGNLEVTLRSGEQLDAAAFIELFERSGLFSDVSATFAGQERELRMKARVKRAGLS